jgi:Transposase DDE domain
MMRDGKPKGFFYLDHRTVDGRFDVITDTYATPANVHDSIPYLARLDRQRKRFRLPGAAVRLDAGMRRRPSPEGLRTRYCRVTGCRAPIAPKPGMMRRSKFAYDRDSDAYHCPQGQSLTYALTDRDGYRHYRSDRMVCSVRPLLASRTTNGKAERTQTRHIWQDARERADARRLSDWGKRLYARRKETVERSFADAKQLLTIAMPGFEGSFGSNANA